MPTSYKGQFVKGGKKTSSHSGKTYDAGQGKPHLSGKDLHKREGKELSEAGRGSRNAISDKYLREAINALVSAGAKPDNYGSSGAVADATRIKEQASKLAEEHLQYYRKKEYTAILDDHGNKVKVAKSKATEGADYVRPTVKRAETRGLKDKLSTNLKEFINNYVNNKLKDAKPVEVKKSNKKEKSATKEKAKTEVVNKTSKKSEVAKSSKGKGKIELKVTKDTAYDVKVKEARELKGIAEKTTSKYKLSDLNDKNKITAVTFAVAQTQNKSSAYNVSVDANGNAKFSLIKGKSDPEGKEKKSLQRTFKSKLEDKVDGLKRAEIYVAEQSKSQKVISMKEKGISTKGLTSNTTAKRDNIPAPTKKEIIGNFDASQALTKKANKPLTRKALKEQEKALKGDIEIKTKVESAFQKFKNSLTPEQKIKYLGLDKQSTTSNKDGNSLISSAKKLISENKSVKKSNVFSGRQSIKSMGTKYNSLTQNSDIRNVLKSRKSVSKKYPVKIELDSEGYVKDIKLTNKGKKEKFNLTEQAKSNIALKYYGEVRSNINYSGSKSLSKKHVESFGNIPKRALDISYYIREKGMTYSQALKKVQNKKKRK